MSTSCKGRSPLRGGLMQNSGARVVRTCNMPAPEGLAGKKEKCIDTTAKKEKCIDTTAKKKNNNHFASKNNFRRIKCEYIRGKKWHPFLIHKDNRKKYLCLLDDIGYNSTNIYVRLTTKGYYMFSNFSNGIELRNYINQFHPTLKCFDEIIMEGPQKPRFDIDLEDDNYSPEELDRIIQILINQVIDGIMFYLPEISPERNIRLFTSHGKKKRSVHIVIDGFFHDNYLDARGFYDDAIRHVNVGFRKYVDHGIYGKKKQLRMMDCCKWESDRNKKLQNSFLYYDKVINCNWGELDNDVTRFISSLVTVISGCERLPSFAKRMAYNKSENVADGIVDDAIEMTKTVLGENYTFSFESVTGSIIVLKRLSPSKCVICNRIHEKQHPFLSITNDNVYFFCRRHPQNKSQYIGNIHTHVEKTQTKPEPFARVDITTAEGKTIQVGGSASFNFRRKHKSSTSSSSSSSANTQEEFPVNIDNSPGYQEPVDTAGISPLVLSSGSEIFNKLNNIDKKRIVKHRMPKFQDDTPLSSLIDFNQIDW